MARLSDDEVVELIYAALAINDKLRVDEDHADFCGSMSDVEDFRDTINHLWHRSCGWVAETESSWRRDMRAAQEWYRQHERTIRDAGVADCPDFMIPF